MTSYFSIAWCLYANWFCADWHTELFKFIIEIRTQPWWGSQLICNLHYSPIPCIARNQIIVLRVHGHGHRTRNVVRVTALVFTEYLETYPVNSMAVALTTFLVLWTGDVMTSSNGNIFRVTGHLCGDFSGPRWIPRTKASDAELWCFLWSASELSKQSWGWWFEKLSRPLWRHCNGTMEYIHMGIRQSLNPTPTALHFCTISFLQHYEIFHHETWYIFFAMQYFLDVYCISCRGFSKW